MESGLVLNNIKHNITPILIFFVDSKVRKGYKAVEPVLQRINTR